MKSAWGIAVAGVLVVAAACTSSGTESSTFDSATADASVEDVGQMCCFATCNSVFRTSFSLAVDDATLHASTFSICRNASCATTTLAGVLISASSESSQTVPVDASTTLRTGATPRANLTVWGRATANEPLRMDVDYQPYGSADWKDGDVYELTLKDDKGTVLYHLTTAVTYTVSQVCCSTCGTAAVDGGSGVVFDGGSDGGN